MRGQVRAAPRGQTLADPPVRRQLLMMPRVHPCMPECLRLRPRPRRPAPARFSWLKTEFSNEMATHALAARSVDRGEPALRRTGLGRLLLLAAHESRRHRHQSRPGEGRPGCRHRRHRGKPDRRNPQHRRPDLDRPMRGQRLRRFQYRPECQPGNVRGGQSNVYSTNIQGIGFRSARLAATRIPGRLGSASSTPPQPPCI